MGRKIKKVIMIAAFGMVTGGQIADLLPEGNVMQVEAGSRKQIIKAKNKEEFSGSRDELTVRKNLTRTKTTPKIMKRI